MKTYLFPSIALLLLQTGCAHVNTVAWQGDNIKLCGNKFANADDFDREAGRVCNGAHKNLSIWGQNPAPINAATATVGTPALENKKANATVT